MPRQGEADAQGKPTEGYGIILYADGSVYYGDQIFDGQQPENMFTGDDTHLNAKGYGVTVKAVEEIIKGDVM